MDERRQYPRLDTTKINFLCKKIDHKDEKSQDPAKDISEGGIRLSLGEEEVKVGDILKLEFMLPSRNFLISCKGKVKWVEEFEIIGKVSKKEFEAGVEFFDISDVDQKAVKEFVFSLLPKKPDS